MKKLNILYIIFVVFFNIAARMIHIWAISAKNNHLISLFATLIIVVLPCLYGAVSYFLIGRLPKAMLMNLAGLTVSAIIITLYRQCPPLSEGVWFVLHIPAILISYFAAKLVRAMPARKYQCLLALLFFAVLAVIAGVMYYVICAILSIGHS